MILVSGAQLGYARRCDVQDVEIKFEQLAVLGRVPEPIDIDRFPAACRFTARRDRGVLMGLGERANQFRS